MILRRTSILALAATALFFFASAAAQNGIVKGTVVDDQTGEPIDKVIIKIEGLNVKRNYQVKTNKKGEFIHIGVSAQNSYRVIAEMEGYRPDFVQGVRPVFDRSDSSSDVVFRLKKGSGQLALGMSDEQRAKLAEEADKVKKRNSALQESFTAGVEAYNAGDYEIAKTSFLKSAEVAPEEPNVWGNLGRTYAALDENDQAIESYQKAIELNPAEASFRQNLGNLYSKLGRDDEAEAEFTQAAEIAAASDPKAAAASYYNMAVGHINAGKNQEAEAALTKAIEFDPNHGEAHYQLAIVLLGSGKNKESVEHFKQYLVLAPTGPNAETAKLLLEELDK